MEKKNKAYKIARLCNLLKIINAKLKILKIFKSNPVFIMNKFRKPIVLIMDKKYKYRILIQKIYV